MAGTARMVTIAAATLLTFVPAGVAAAAESPSGDPPARGTVAALDGAASDGQTFSSSQPIHDPVYGTCYDLLTSDGHAADWTEVVNGTNRTIGVSSQNCTHTLSGEATKPLASSQRSTGLTYRAFIVAPGN